MILDVLQGLLTQKINIVIVKPPGRRFIELPTIKLTEVITMSNKVTEFFKDAFDMKESAKAQWEKAKAIGDPARSKKNVLITQKIKIKAVLSETGLPLLYYDRTINAVRCFYFISSSVSRIISGAIFSRSFFMILL